MILHPILLATSKSRIIYHLRKYIPIFTKKICHIFSYTKNTCGILKTKAIILLLLQRNYYFT